MGKGENTMNIGSPLFWNHFPFLCIFSGNNEDVQELLSIFNMQILSAGHNYDAINYSL